jgi:hypothetical protein
VVLVRFRAFWGAIVQQFVLQFLEPEEPFPGSEIDLLIAFHPPRAQSNVQQSTGCRSFEFQRIPLSPP